MWYTGGMRTRAQCSCGWQLELSEFYAGKQLRCPQCERVVNVPGESTTPLYGSSLPQRTGPGEWRPVRYGTSTRGACHGSGVFVVIMVIVVFTSVLNQCRRDQAAEQKRVPSERVQPTQPSEEKEEDF
jgi:hypothetical protein